MPDPGTATPMSPTTPTTSLTRLVYFFAGVSGSPALPHPVPLLIPAQEVTAAREVPTHLCLTRLQIAAIPAELQRQRRVCNQVPSKESESPFKEQSRASQAQLLVW